MSGDQLNDDPTRDESAEVQSADVESAEDAAAKARPSQRLEQQALWVDAQIKQAMSRGEFDNLPGAGKPIEGLGGTHDPDWWVKQLIEREQISGMGPPAILLRKEDAELDASLDRVSAEAEVRRLVTDFNARVVDARRQLLGGPPVVTKTRDVDAEVESWKTRREERRRSLRAANEERRATGATSDPEPSQSRRRWWRRRRD